MEHEHESIDSQSEATLDRDPQGATLEMQTLLIDAHSATHLDPHVVSRPAVEFRNVTGIYGSSHTRVVALDDVTVEFPSGSWTADGRCLPIALRSSSELLFRRR